MPHDNDWKARRRLVLLYNYNTRPLPKANRPLIDSHDKLKLPLACPSMDLLHLLEMLLLVLLVVGRILDVGHPLAVLEALGPGFLAHLAELIKRARDRGGNDHS